MAQPEFTLRQLIEAGVHFGHQSHRWNPLMAPYIHSKRNGIHIIDLTQTVTMMDAALQRIAETVSKDGSILFVGTKRQAQTNIKEAAERCAQYYINQRWLGGMLTNWKTVSNSIQRLNSIDKKLELGVEGLTKKELLGMRREQAKLQASLGGIRKMKGVPDMLFVIDVRKEAIAVAEANKLGIPVVAIVDTNCSPNGIDHMIPGNDDAHRAIKVYCNLVAQAVLEGLQLEASGRGEDIGENAEGPSVELRSAGLDSESTAEDSSAITAAADEASALDSNPADSAEKDTDERESDPVEEPQPASQTSQ